MAIIIFTALLIGLVNVSWWYYYSRTRGLLDRELSRRLEAAAQLAAIQLDAGMVEGLLLGDVESYAGVTSVLEQVRAADSLSEVFVLDPAYRYQATTALEFDSLYFLTALNGPIIDSLVYGVALAASSGPTYAIGGIYLKSAFAPLYGYDDIPVAVLGVEASVDYFDSLAELRMNLRYATALSILGGLVLGAFFVAVQRRINRTEQQLFLSQTHAHLGRMVAVVSHELKNPLMILRASAERLNKKSESEEAKYVVEEVDRLSGIVTGYLDFARSGDCLLAGEQPETFDLAELIGSSRKHLTERYAPEPVEWLGSVPTVDLTMVGFRRSLRQVLLNLLINGAEACLSAGRPIAVGIAVEPTEQRVRLNIIDRGPGIPRKELKRIFEPFYTTKQSGSGLGLYLTRRIVSEMGGTISISGRDGEGTEVIIDLPRRPTV